MNVKGNAHYTIGRIEGITKMGRKTRLSDKIIVDKVMESLKEFKHYRAENEKLQQNVKNKISDSINQSIDRRLL